MRDDSSVFYWALLISLLLHVLLLFLVVPGVSKLWSQAFAVEIPPQASTPEKPPLEFEFVDLPDDREEKPQNSEEAKLSDMDRRAHGGVGKKAPKPSSRGNTPQIVQAEGRRQFGSGAPPQNSGPPAPPVKAQRPSPERQAPRPKEAEAQKEGAGQKEQKRESSKTSRPRIQLPPTGSFVLPPGLGGIRENPDRKGGMIDSGGISFDTQWYDWGPYAKLMLAKIRRNWRIPEIAQLGVAGRVQIRFFIQSDGSVTGLRITDESGKPPMDFAARDAISHSSPFNPLPPDLAGIEKEGVTITFFYNSNPPERAGH